MFGTSLRRSSWRDDLQLTRRMRVCFNCSDIGDQLWILRSRIWGNEVTKRPSCDAFCVMQRVKVSAVINQDGIILRMVWCSTERSRESISTRCNWGKVCNSKRNCESGGVYPLDVWILMRPHILFLWLEVWALTVTGMAPRRMNSVYHLVLQHVDIYNHTVDVVLLPRWASNRHVHTEQGFATSSEYPLPQQRMRWFYATRHEEDKGSLVSRVSLRAYKWYERMA